MSLKFPFHLLKLKGIFSHQAGVEILKPEVNLTQEDFFYLRETLQVLLTAVFSPQGPTGH